MTQIFTFSDPTQRDALLAMLKSRSDDHGDVSGVVREIIADVRHRGDAALIDYTAKFDRLTLDAPERLRVSDEEIAQAQAECPPEVKDALELAVTRIRAYHEKQRPENLRYTDESGTELGWQWNAMDAVGLYVPGGLASYPSSVLMNGIPAKVAGCLRLVMVVPTPDGVMNPAVLVAAKLAQVDEIYRVGGAQAVAALAYGTSQIAPVDKIVGPGNAYVAEAKRQVFGQVGIDTIAGPSEICVVADDQNDPCWIAADLLSQAEHDKAAQSVLICNDESYAARVCEAVEATLKTLDREEIARVSWEAYGTIVIVKTREEVAQAANLIAPEHLELAIEQSEAEALLPMVRHAGAIFMGRYTPEAIGDYVAGPSHVLPTTRAARFSSGLNVLDFMKKSSLIHCTRSSFEAIANQGEALAKSEGLGAHGLSISIRG